MLLGEVDQAAAHERAFVDAVERTEGAVGFGEVDFERSGGGGLGEAEQEGDEPQAG